MQIESEIQVARPRAEVFEYIAHAEYLPQYVTDFDVGRAGLRGSPAVGTEYSYKMGRGAEGTFEWTRFEPTRGWSGTAPPSRPGRDRWSRRAGGS